MVKEFTNPPATTTSNDVRLDALEPRATAIESTLQTVTGDGTGIDVAGDVTSTTAALGSYTVATNAFNCTTDLLIQRASTTKMIIYTDAVAMWDHTRPVFSNNFDLGTATYRWRTPYSVNALNTSSDIRKKKNIKPCNLGMNFIKRLKPVCYEYDNDPDGHTRLGFIAQDVKKACDAYTNMADNALIQEDENEEDPENPWLSMGYTEFIAPMVSAMQDMEKEINKLKKEIELLKQANAQ